MKTKITYAVLFLITHLSTHTDAHAQTKDLVSYHKGEITIIVKNLQSVNRLLNNENYIAVNGQIGNYKKMTVSDSETVCVMGKLPSLSQTQLKDILVLDSAPQIDIEKEKDRKTKTRYEIQIATLSFHHETLGIECNKFLSAGKITLADIQAALNGLIEFQIR